MGHHHIEKSSKKCKGCKDRNNICKQSYAGFGPMTAKLFAEMIGLTRTISFPIQDHKSFIKTINLDRYQNENSFKINKRSLKKTKQTELSEFFE
jgi:hypothetical protein